MNKYLKIGLLILITCGLLGVAGWVYTQRSSDSVSPESETPGFLPLAPGAWAKYQVKRVKEETTGIKTIWTSDIKVTVTGQERSDAGGPKYWLELVVNEGKDYQKVFRFMVNENGEPQPERLVVKRGVLNAVEMDLNLWAMETGISAEEMLKESIGHFWFMPFPYLFSEETKSVPEKINLMIKGNRESFSCSRYISKKVMPEVTAKVWLCHQVPVAGVAKMILLEEGYQTLFSLEDFGAKDGRSIIKERPTALSFKEGK
jgi:hypothetical protein